MRWLTLGGIILMAGLLTGCFQYDLALHFDHPHHGQVVQRLHWSGTSALGPGTSPDWQRQLGERVRQVGGQVRSPAPDTLEITLPFTNGRDLVHRFNQFFGSEAPGTPLTLPGGAPLTAHLDLHQGNWLLAVYTQLTLEVDLRALPDGSALGAPRLQAVQWFTGQVTLETPWGWRSPTLPDQGAEVPWPLAPGQLNTVEASFWLPSPIGIGAGIIALLVMGGYGLKYRWR